MDGRRGLSRPAGHGPERALVAAYALFALAALGRASVQIATRWSEAPLPYALSALAAALYLVIAIALARGGPASRRVVAVGCGVELTGVLVVGILGLADPGLFPDATVWSGFGIGYGFVPLLLPVLGLAWVARDLRAPRAQGAPG